MTKRKSATAAPENPPGGKKSKKEVMTGTPENPAATAAEAASPPAEMTQKEINDRKHYERIVETTSKRAMKKLICFSYAKGKCKKGDACALLHAGAKIANPGKAKRVKMREANPRPEKKKKEKLPKHWKCEKCGNANWMRRKVCNGASCQDQLNPFIGVGKEIAAMRAAAAARGEEGGSAQAAPQASGSTPSSAAGAGVSTAAGKPGASASRRLFLRKLSYEITEAKLRAFFSGCGGVESVHFLTDKRTGKINAGFVEFATLAGAQAGIGMAGEECCGRPVRIEFAKEVPKKSEAGAAKKVGTAASGEGESAATEAGEALAEKGGQEEAEPKTEDVEDVEDDSDDADEDSSEDDSDDSDDSDESDESN
eukprot:SAG25_NODE_350_length_9343_cov_9.011370_2_plen_368_part_00